MSTKTHPTPTLKCTKNTVPSGYELVEPKPPTDVFCGGNELTRFKQEVYVEGECDNCGCGVGLKADVTEQAKKRFNAARKHLYAAVSDFNKVLKKNQQVIECPTVDIVQALRIASGLDPIPSSKS